MTKRKVKTDEKDAAAVKVLQGLFDGEYVYAETFKRIKADAAMQAKLDAYNAACVAYDDGEMEVDDFNELENAYYATVFAPVSVAVARDVLERAKEFAEFQPWGPRARPTE